MLDKFKFFKDKDKSKSSSKLPAKSATTTSSSSSVQTKCDSKQSPSVTGVAQSSASSKTPTKKGWGKSSAAGKNKNSDEKSSSKSEMHINSGKLSSAQGNGQTVKSPISCSTTDPKSLAENVTGTNKSHKSGSFIPKNGALVGTSKGSKMSMSSSSSLSSSSANNSSSAPSTSSSSIPKPGSTKPTGRNKDEKTDSSKNSAKQTSQNSLPSRSVVAIRGGQPVQHPVPDIHTQIEANSKDSAHILQNQKNHQYLLQQQCAQQQQQNIAQQQHMQSNSSVIANKGYIPPYMNDSSNAVKYSGSVPCSATNVQSSEHIAQVPPTSQVIEDKRTKGKVTEDVAPPLPPRNPNMKVASIPSVTRSSLTQAATSRTFPLSSSHGHKFQKSSSPVIGIVRPSATIAPSMHVNSNVSNIAKKADENTQTQLTSFRRSLTPSRFTRDSSADKNMIAGLSNLVIQSPRTATSENAVNAVVNSSSTNITSKIRDYTTDHQPANPTSKTDGAKPQNNQNSHNVKKIETTFDQNIRTEKISKETRFVTNFDTLQKVPGEEVDSGASESLSIKPMQPIMRTLPYGYLRGATSSMPNKSFHIPGITVPNSVYGSVSSRLAIHRSLNNAPILSPCYPQYMRRPICESSTEGDYNSDIESLDYGSGYMSDGDILRGTRSDDTGSGYISEGGASVYARRLQQRFREGMQAVKESMQKSNGVLDDDSFDDSSSVSSGEISDVIGDLSADDGFNPGISTGNHSQFVGVKSPALARNLPNGGVLVTGGKNSFYVPPNSAQTGREYFNPNDPNIAAWQRYVTVPVNNRCVYSDDEYARYGTYGSASTSFTPDVPRKFSQPDTCSRPNSGTYSDHYGHGSPMLLNKYESNNNADPRYLRRNASLSSGQPTASSPYRVAYPLPEAAINGNFLCRRPGPANNIVSSSSKVLVTPSKMAASRLAQHSTDLSPDCSSIKSNQDRALSYDNSPLRTVPRLGSVIPKNSQSNDSFQMSDPYLSNSLERRKQAVFQQISRSGVVFDPSITGQRRLFVNPNPDMNCRDNVIRNPYVKGIYSGGYLVGTECSSPAMMSGVKSTQWIKQGPTGIPLVLSETESMESLSSCTSSIQAQIQHARALSGVSARILANQSNSPHPGNMSHNSSGQGEDVAPFSTPRKSSYSHVTIGEQAPASPTPSTSSQPSRFTYPMAAYASGQMTQSPNVNQNSRRGSRHSSSPGGTPPSGRNEVHGSSASLSSASSFQSMTEERHAIEIEKLKRELELAQETVQALTSQLNTNAHVVAAFEQSLSNMTARLHHLSSTSTNKDTQLNELRSTIEALKDQSGLAIPEILISPSSGRRHISASSSGAITRQISSDSMSSINSLSSACSTASQQSSPLQLQEALLADKKAKKKGWLRSSFGKAFGGRKKLKNSSLSDAEIDAHVKSDSSTPNSPLICSPHMSVTLKSSPSANEVERHASMSELRHQLREKDMKLTDIRLEALTSAHQLEQLRETMNKMKNEMFVLKADNDRLQKLMSQPQSPSHSTQSTLQRCSTIDTTDNDVTSLETLLREATDKEGKRVIITVCLGSDPSPHRKEKNTKVLIGSLSVSGKTKWDILDSIVRKIFKEYVLRVDPATNLGLNCDSVHSYHIGEITRTKDTELPELLPVGYLVGDTMSIEICLKGTQQNSVDSLSFESLMPKSFMQRYVALLLEHRRIILCGPSGTGKTYLAHKLAHHIILRCGREVLPGAIATYNVDHKSASDLRHYLSNIASQCENASDNELPTVIILDNLHHVPSLSDVFNGFLNVKVSKCPYMIGTMSHTNSANSNLQLHHNFRWILCVNHMEPVKGFIARYLRRKLVEAEVHMGTRNNDLSKIVEWLPKVWQHVNQFLETHNSSDVTIGPRLFLACPMDIAGSQVWFTDLWNYSIIPYCLQAVRDGLSKIGKRGAWEDPSEWVIESYPWMTNSNQDWPSLVKLRPEDVGFDVVTDTESILTVEEISAPDEQSRESESSEGDQTLKLATLLEVTNKNPDEDLNDISYPTTDVPDINSTQMRDVISAQ